MTLANELGKRTLDSAPRMDVVGERGLQRIYELLGRSPPSKERLFAPAMLGELVSNGAYYSLASAGRRDRALLRGALLGAAAGVGAVVLTPRLGLGRKVVGRTRGTQLMTVGWYLLGGLVAGAVAQLGTEPAVRTSELGELKRRDDVAESESWRPAHVGSPDSYGSVTRTL